MDWDKWIAEQDEAVCKAYEEHVAGLKTALKTERDASKALQGQVKELTDKATAVDAAQSQLAALQAKVTEMETGAATSAKALAEAQGKLGDTTKQFGFFKAAAEKGVTNLDNAYLIALGKGLIGDDGSLDWEAFRKAAPEQFGTTSASNPSRGTTLTMEDVKKMTPEQYNQNRDAVNAVLAQQRT